MVRYFSLGLVALAAMLCAGCQDSSEPVSANFGKFEGDVVASWDDDGRRMTLRETFKYIDPKDRTWTAPAGTVVDGASIPSAFWTLIGGPFEGKYRKASVVHDIGCVEMKESWEDVHWMFYEACRCAGVGESEAKTLYYAVYHFGPRWQQITDTVVEKQTDSTGETIEQEVTVQRMARLDPPPPTTEELQHVEAYVAEENPTPEAIKTFTRGALRKRTHHGPDHKPAQPDRADKTADDNGSDAAAKSIVESSRHPRPEFTRTRPELGSSGSRPAHAPGEGAPRTFWTQQDRPQGAPSRQGYPAIRRPTMGNYSATNRPAISPDEEQWAGDQVGKYIEEQTGEVRPATYAVEQTRGGFKVLVQYLHADEAGELVPTEGMTSNVRLSRQGDVLEFISSEVAPAETPATPEETTEGQRISSLPAELPTANEGERTEDDPALENPPQNYRTDSSTAQPDPTALNPTDPAATEFEYGFQPQQIESTVKPFE